MCRPHYCIGKEYFYENNNYVTDYPCEGHHPEWCKFCTHFGSTDNRYNACAEGSAVQIFSYGPALVSFSGHCDKFAWAANQGGKHPNPSLIKRFLLSIDNFKYACDKQR